MVETLVVVGLNFNWKLQFTMSGLRAFVWGTPHTRLMSARQISFSSFQGPESPDSMDYTWRKARNRIDLPLCFQCRVSVWHVSRHLICVCWTELLGIALIRNQIGLNLLKRDGKSPEWHTLLRATFRALWSIRFMQAEILPRTIICQ